MGQIHFGKGIKYDTGVTTDISISNDNLLVEVHESENKDTLWYHTGKASIFGVEWNDSQKYDTGLTPSVDINKHGVVVEVHSSQNKDTLWYHVGQYEGSTIKWGPSYKYDTGKNPCVAINDEGLVVEVHQSQNEGTLWYHVGRVEGDQIKWSDSQRYDTGQLPAVSLNNYGDVVEVHMSQNHNTLWYHVGKLNDSNIDWGSSQKYDTGVTPSVSINDERTVVEVHKSSNHDTLWSHIGTINGNNISFGSSYKYDTGIKPAVSCNEELAIQSHESENYDNLWYSSALLVNHPTWMAEEKGLGEKELWQVTLPGSHDSGTYDLSSDIAPSGDVPEWMEIIFNITKYVPSLPTFLVHKMIDNLLHDWSEAQELNIEEQLNMGIRYFDLRPCVDDGNIYTHHGLIGPKFEDICQQVQRYMQSVSKELVVLNISHFANFKDKNHQDLVNMINKYLGDFLYNNMNANLLQTKIKDYVSDGPRIILVYNDDYISSNPALGFWRYFSLFDEYANTPSFSKMKSDQLEKLKNNSGTQNQMFLLSWTLTPDQDTIVDDALDRINPFSGHSTLQKLSARANIQLGSFLKDYASDYKINVLYVDFCEDYNVTDLAIRINRQ